MYVYLLAPEYNFIMIPLQSTTPDTESTGKDPEVDACGSSRGSGFPPGDFRAHMREACRCFPGHLVTLRFL